MATHLFRLSPRTHASWRDIAPRAQNDTLVTGAVRSFSTPLLHAIHIQKGRVWITCDGDHEDHMLTAGDLFVPSSPGTIVLEALTPAVIEIDQG